MDRPRGRTLTATYVFHNSDLNGLGGVLQIQPSGTAAALCMDAGSRTGPPEPR